MLHKLTFSNFYSFKDRVTVDFLVDQHAPDTDGYFTDAHGNRVSKLMTVIGANASGKTNLLKSITFLKWFMLDSFSSLEPDQDIGPGFKPFLFCSDTNVSSFEMIFAVQEEIFEYKLDLTNKFVVSEVLRMKNIDTKKWNTVFSRTRIADSDEYDDNYVKLEVPSDFSKLVRQNSSVLSAARQINNKYAIKITEYFSNIQTNVGTSNNFKHVIATAEFFHKQPKMKEQAEKILKRFDLGISKLDIQEMKHGTEEPFYLPRVYHKHSDEDKHAPTWLFEESGGTQNLFILLQDILTALDKGSVVVFDELDNNLHALMVPEVINLFKSEIHNPHNAQLLFSTHNIQILNELDKQQIIIVEKNENNISEAWKLSDIEGVRPNDNYYAKYLAGVYGGIPKF